MKVGIVGAGIAGLACARELERAGIKAELFDKGKRPGGRLSTLRLGDLAWDFGAQYVKSSEGEFSRQVAAWRDANVLADWHRGPPGALVGVPGMASLVESQCAGLAVRFGLQVQRLERAAQGWTVIGPGFQAGPFAALVLAIPAEQAVALLALHDLHMARDAAGGISQPCWTVMAAFNAPLVGVADVLRPQEAIAWAARNNSKPGRSAEECWVVQASADWSRRNLECSPDVVAQELLAALAEAAGCTLSEVQFLKAHRWRFALTQGGSHTPLWNPALQLGACGDWCGAAHIEGAWLAGTDLARTVAAKLGQVETEDPENAAEVERVAGIEPA